MECRKLKLVTSWNAAGIFMVAMFVAFISFSNGAGAMLVYSYYSNQIIITTDERRGPRSDAPPGPFLLVLRAAIMKSVTYFADLSPYSYGLNGRYGDLAEQPDAVNIGWLGAGHEFPAGQAPG